MTDYPEHEKLELIMHESQAIGEFLEWLTSEKGYVLAERHKHTADCRGDDKILGCGATQNELLTVVEPVRKLLAEYFGIDENRLEEEKRKLLESLRTGK